MDHFLRNRVENFNLKITFLILGLLCSMNRAFAGDSTSLVPQSVSPVVQQKHIIPKAIQLEFSTKGAAHFGRNLVNIFSNLGLSIDEVYSDSKQIRLDKNIDLGAVKASPATLKLIDIARRIMGSGQLVKPLVDLNNSSYQATFNRFLISSDVTRLKALGKTDGAILTLFVELQNLNLGSSKVLLTDQNSPAAPLGFDNIHLRVAGENQTPLKIQVSVYVSVSDKGVPEFEVVDLRQNFQQIRFQVNNNYNLVLPDIQILVNGKPSAFNPNEYMKQEFKTYLPAFIQQLPRILNSYATEKLSPMINEIAKQHLVKAIEEIKPMGVPGAVKGRDKPYQWGLRLKDISQKDNLRLTLDTFIEDDQNAASHPDSSLFSLQSPLLNNLPQDQFDVAVGVDLAVINRLLQLSYERKLFEKIPLDNPPTEPQKCPTEPAKRGQVLKFTESPVLVPVNIQGLPALGWGETYAKLKLAVQVPDGTISKMSFQRVAIKDDFLMKINLILKLKKSGTGNSLTAQLWGFEKHSIEVDDRYLTWVGSKIKDSVIDGIADHFKKMAANWQCNSTTIASDIPFPNSFLGLGSSLKHIVVEPGGHLTFYLNFIDRGNGL